MPLSKVDLPAPLGPHQGQQVAGSNLPGQMMNRGMALVTERQILKRERNRIQSRRDGNVHASAQAIATQRTAATPATMARRAGTLAPSRETAE
jgi:hypothetical protein